MAEKKPKVPNVKEILVRTKREDLATIERAKDEAVQEENYLLAEVYKQIHEYLLLRIR